MVPASGNNGMAIASLVCSIVGLCCGILAILGIIFGFVALNQIKQRGQGGAQLAKAGIIIGIIALVLNVGWAIFNVATGGTYYSFNVG